MSTFVDTFDRADGALGGNWVQALGSPVVTGHRCGAVSDFIAVDTTVGDTGRVYASIHLLGAPLGVHSGGVVVKHNGSSHSGYLANYYVSGGTYYFGLYYSNGTVWSSLTYTSLGTTPTYYNLIELEWSNGHLTATLNGTTTLEADNTAWAAGLYGGCQGYATYQYVDDIRIEDSTATGLSASPDAVGNYGGCTDVTLTGTSTSWTSGTPGSPTFTVDHGTISAQTVNSATEAVVTYCPGSFLGTATFTDPTTGNTASVLVTSNPGTVPPPDTADPWLHDDGVLAIATTELFDPDYILTDQSPIIESTEEVPGRLAILDAIRQIWQAHFGEWTGSPPEPTAEKIEAIWAGLNGRSTVSTPYGAVYDEPVAATVKKILDVWLQTTEGPLWTVNDIMEAIAGVGGADVEDVRHDIGIVDQETWTSILQVLLGMWGPGADTLTTLGTRFDNLVTLAGWNLQNVKDWIEAIPACDLSDVETAISNLRGGTATVTEIYNLLSDMNDDLQAVKVSLSELRTAEALTLQDILDAIAAIPPGEGGEYLGPPTWPGASNVTLGTPVALADQLHITDEMDGIIIIITTPPTATGQRRHGGMTYYYGIGELAFEDDDGRLEMWQYFGFATMICTPHSLQRAGGVRFRVLAGAEGTVTPWVRS